jgi:hypothetical protein
VANVQAETGVVFYASFRPSQDKGVADLWLKRKPPWVDSSKKLQNPSHDFSWTVKPASTWVLKPCFVLPEQLMSVFHLFPTG